MIASITKSKPASTLPNPEQSFALQDLLRQANSGRGGAKKQVDQLAHTGLIREDARRCQQCSIRAKTNFPLYTELLSIARKSFGVAEPLKQALQHYAESISSAFVFGSIAKGSEGARSDIDLILVGTALLLEITGGLYQVEQELKRPINFSLYEPQEWVALVQSDPVMAQIAQDNPAKSRFT